MRRLILLLLIILVPLAAFAGWWLRGRTPQRDGSVLLDAAATAQRTWPLDRAWAWEVPLPQDAREARMSVRGLSATPEQHVQITRADRTPIAEDQAEVRFGTAWSVFNPAIATPPPHVQATIQLIDLHDIGVTPQDGRALRILGTHSGGGTTSRLTGTDRLPIGRLSGWRVVNGQNWLANELHLMSFSIEQPDRIWSFDVVLMRQP